MSATNSIRHWINLYGPRSHSLVLSACQVQLFENAIYCEGHIHPHQTLHLQTHLIKCPVRLPFIIPGYWYSCYRYSCEPKGLCKYFQKILTANLRYDPKKMFSCDLYQWFCLKGMNCGY